MYEAKLSPIMLSANDERLEHPSPIVGLNDFLVYSTLLCISLGPLVPTLGNNDVFQ